MSYSNLHILADFDWTLSHPYSKEWERISWIIALIRLNTLLWEWQKEQASELFNHYRPIEHDPSISKQEKLPLMEERWQKVNDILIKHWLSMNTIQEIIDCGQVRFRSWWEEFFSFINSNTIPLIIYSASGIWTPTIKLFLEKHNLLNDSINIVSNDFNRDEQWNATSTKWRIMNTYNKDTFQLSDFAWFDEALASRKHAVVLWDSLWDIDIGKTHTFDHVTSIWFLNKKQPDKESLDAYTETFDYVLNWDNWFKEILDIIQ